jgi:hypothetical protein
MNTAADNQSNAAILMLYFFCWWPTVSTLVKDLSRKPVTSRCEVYIYAALLELNHYWKVL